jgi:hypothetical protein
LVFALAGCAASGGWDSAEVIARKELDARLEAIWVALATGTRAPSGAPPKDLPWQPQYSPLFPQRWPPGSDAGWIQYGYASRIEMGLADAVRISRPWVTIRFRRGEPGVTVTRLGVPEPAEIQGFGPSPVRPFETRSQESLGRGSAVFDYCLGLTSLPDPRSSETARMRSAYSAWGASNGAFRGLVRGEHEAFFAWLEAEP